MKSDLIGKIAKARRYAQERHRVLFQALEVTFQGEHDLYHVSLKDNRWRCSCDFFAGRGLCSHSMALEHILEGMLPQEAIPRLQPSPTGD